MSRLLSIILIIILSLNASGQEVEAKKKNQISIGGIVGFYAIHPLYGPIATSGFGSEIIFPITKNFHAKTGLWFTQHFGKKSTHNKVWFGDFQVYRETNFNLHLPFIIAFSPMEKPKKIRIYPIGGIALDKLVLRREKILNSSNEDEIGTASNEWSILVDDFWISIISGGEIKYQITPFLVLNFQFALRYTAPENFEQVGIYGQNKGIVGPVLFLKLNQVL